MASAHSLAAVSVLDATSKQRTLVPWSSTSSTLQSLRSKLSVFPNLRSKGKMEIGNDELVVLGAAKAKAKAKAQGKEGGEVSPVVGGEIIFNNPKHLLLPVIDRNPYLSEGTRQAAATTASLATKYGADITVVVIDEEKRESSSEHETQVSNIRWHLAQGGFEEYKLLERLGEGKKATAIIGEVADELRMELVVMSMEAIHSKFIDANLLAEFIPCPVLLLPL